MAQADFTAITREQHDIWIRDLMAQPNTRREPEFEYEQFQELIRNHQERTGEPPRDIMLTEQHYRQLQSNIALRLDIHPIEAPGETPNIVQQIDGVNIHLMPDDLEPEAPPPPTYPGVSPGQQNAHDRLYRQAAEAMNQAGGTIAHADVTIPPVTFAPPPPRDFPDHAADAMTFARNTEEANWIMPERETEPGGVEITAEYISREQIRENVEFQEHRADYDQRLNVTATLNLHRALSTELARGSIEQVRALLQENLILDYHQRLNPEHVYSFIDDELRDFIFWMHQNISKEMRVEADEKFNNMKNRIWPEERTRNGL